MNGKIRKMENGRLVWRKPSDLDQNRIRFNWGYHDGARDAQTGYVRPDDLDQHYDTVYVQGYWAGQSEERDGGYMNDSTIAWKASGIQNGVTVYRWA